VDSDHHGNQHINLQFAIVEKIHYFLFFHDAFM